MPAMRHVLTDNHWEMQCPICQQFVPIDREVFVGRAPLPRHQRWAPSWAHMLAERYGWTFRYPRLIWLVVRAEVWTRRHLPRGPWCDYTPTVDWTEQWPASGMTSYGPTT